MLKQYTEIAARNKTRTRTNKGRNINAGDLHKLLLGVLPNILQRVVTDVLIQLTLLLSSCSSSFMELEGEGVADLLAGGDGEVWVILGPAILRLSGPLSWDWLMVVNWFRDIIPLGPFMVMMDFITMAGLGGYWRRWPGPRFCNR